MNSKWEKVRLAEVLHHVPRPVDVNPDATYREIGIRSHGKGVFHKEPLSGIDLGTKKVFHVAPGDFVLNIVFAWEGAVAVLGEAEKDMIGSHRFPTFRCDEERLSAQFLLAYLKTFAGLDLLGRVSPGGAGRNRTLSRSAFLQQVVPLPPIGEQQRIVAKIDVLRALVEEARILRRQAGQSAIALINSVRSTLIGSAPGADWVALSSFVGEIENGKSPQCLARTATANEWGVLKVGAVSFGSFDQRENKALPPSQSFDPAHEVRPGDFLMSRANTPDLVGACAVVRETRPRLLLSDKIFRFHFLPGAEVTPDWLNHALKAPALRDQIKRAASGTSPTMKNISKEKVMSLLVPPHGLADQALIVAELDCLNREVVAISQMQETTAVEIKALLPAILDRAFRGEL